MQRIESGPARTDRNWWIARAVIFIGFAVYFVYDGAIGYPEANRREALARSANQLGKPLTAADLGETPSDEEFRTLQADVSANGLAVTRERVHELLGPPTASRTQGGSTIEYFASLYGFITVEYTGNRVSGRPEALGWTKWKKDKREIKEQFYWAIVPGLIGLYFVYRTYKAITLRVIVDEQGLIYAGERIPFDAIVSVRDFSPRGWVDLYHRVGDREKRLRLDNEKILRFDEIVDAICTAKHFINPVAVYHADQARQEADDARAHAAEDALEQKAEREDTAEGDRDGRS